MGGAHRRVLEEWESPSQAAKAEPTHATAQRRAHPRVSTRCPPSLGGGPAPTTEQARAAPLPAAAGPDDRCLAEPRSNPASI